MKIALAPKGQQRVPALKGDLLLLQAEKAVQHKVWLRKTLPLNLLMLLPGLLFVGTRSKAVLAVLVATYPLVLVVRAILARILSSRIGSEEILLRIEYAKLIARAEPG